MKRSRRAIALGSLLVATWLGCSSDGSAPKPEGQAGQASAGNPSGGGESPSDGSAPQGGAGATAGGAQGVTGGAGDAGGPAIPAAWGCIYFAFGDGKCDCGCGFPDPDCTAQDLEACEICDSVGSCGLAKCPGRIDPDDVTRCLPPPDGWTCTPSTYGDGTSCDCGCGVQDQDCPDTEVASCNECAGEGSCATGPCPSSLAADDSTRCEVPPRWTCDAASYGDGTCHCGCGVVDVDCPDSTVASCEVCDDSSCSRFECAVEPDDNAHCPDPPSSWSCSPRLYRDGDRCDCGCGAIDPDCESSGADACDACDAPGSCSAQPCPSFIDTERNSHCDAPDPPPEWTCPAIAYADGLECDCGCGAVDLDCPSEDFASCVRCLSCGGHGVCEGTVDTGAPTECAPPPDDWACSAEAYRDQICDCGCGIPDSYCQNIELLYVCGNYPVEGCSGGHKGHIDPNHNALCTIDVPGDWTCDRSYYDDGLCDCGCGAVDRDCPSNDVDDCEECDDEGSCSTDACPGSIVADDSAHCSE